jgi:hypothetical protein
MGLADVSSFFADFSAPEMKALRSLGKLVSYYQAKTPQYSTAQSGREAEH